MKELLLFCASSQSLVHVEPYLLEQKNAKAEMDVSAANC